MAQQRDLEFATSEQGEAHTAADPMTLAQGATTSPNYSFGIDIGGSGIKGAIVDLGTGELVTPRLRIATPEPSTPDSIADVVAELLRQAEWDRPFGATFPAVVKAGTTLSAANVDKSWIGTNAEELFHKATGHPAVVLNDADAAGLAEVQYGAAKGVAGVVMVLTFGTGIGSGLFVDGRLVPNTELGHLELDGHDAEKRAAAAVRDTKDLSWSKWTARVQHYLSHVEMLFSPDLFVLGGGVSKNADKWIPNLKLRAPIKPAVLHNNAGFVGAALAAVQRLTGKPA